MKYRSLICFALVLSLMCVALVGCGKSEESSAAEDSSSAAEGVTPTAPADVADGQSTQDAVPTPPAEYAENSDTTSMINPISNQEDLNAINEQIGCNIPSATGNPDNESFTVINSDPAIAQYEFSFAGSDTPMPPEEGALSGSFTLRAGATENDISGVYVDGETLTEALEDGTLTADENGVCSVNDFDYWSNWFVGDMQYSLYGSASEDVFTQYLEYFKANT